MAGYITDTLPKKSFKPWALAHFAQYWPRIGDLHSSHLKYERDVPSYQLAQYHYPVSAKFFADIALKEFWNSYVRVYMHFGDVLRVGKFAAGITYHREAPKRRQTSGHWWVDGPPDRPLESPPNLEVPAQALAYAIGADKLSDQARAARLLKRIRDDIMDWNERYLRKQRKHAWHQTRKEKPDAPRDGRGNLFNVGAFYLS